MITVVGKVNVKPILGWYAALPADFWHDAGEETQPIIVKQDKLVEYNYGGPFAATMHTILDIYKGVKLFNPMLSKLKPGGIVGRHSDSPSAGWLSRIHLPILSNEDAVFCISALQVYMEPGTLYAVDVLRPHSIRNMGEVDRVHFMVDLEWSV